MIIRKQVDAALRASAATAVLGIVLASSPAFAQTAPDQTTTGGPVESIAPAATASTGSDNREIVVTGSRIPQQTITSVAPVTVVSSKDIKLQGTTRLEDLLNTLPQVSAGQTTGISNAATGTATVDLRGLGPTRTLVLINGRRLLPGDPLEPIPDLNAIPAALIKRIDVLTGGASATYGADAVAGVVNFVMDTDFTGIKVDGQYSLYQHDNRNSLFKGLLAQAAASGPGYGDPAGNTADGGTIDATITMGAGLDDNRGHVEGYFGYRKVTAVTDADRDYSACTLQNKAKVGTPKCGGSFNAVPGNVADGASNTYSIGPNRTLVNGTTRYNYAATNYFQRPDERYTAGFFAHYDVSEAVRPYMEFNFMDDRTLAQIAPSGDFGTTLTLNCDNPLISAQALSIICAPANLINGFIGSYPLTAQTPGTGTNAPPITYIDPVTGKTYNKGFAQIYRRNVEGGPRINDLEHTSYRGVIGTKGNLGHGWSYDAYYQYGRTIFAETFLNDVSTSRLKNALDVVTGPNGTPICRVVETGEDPNCVPYDIFSGNIKSAEGYTGLIGTQRGILGEQVADASISGDLGTYGIKTPWADDGLKINFGGEYRKETLEFTVNEEFASGDLSGQGGAVPSTSGNYDVKELFGEAQLPIVHDGFVYDLSLTGGYRRSMYTIGNGNKFDTNTFKAGLDFAPIKDVRLRASFNRAVRAPNIQDLFSPDRVGNDGSNDPCTGRVLTNSAADQGCLLQGLKVGQTVAGNPAGQYNGLIGGNPNLKPERSTTKTFGVVLQPRFVPNLVVTVDYYDIKVKGAIQSFGEDAILSACTTDLNPLACSLIKRNPANGSLWTTTDGYVVDTPRNIGGVHTRGIDVSVAYSHDIGDFGNLSANLSGTYLDKFLVNNGLTTPYDCAGYYGTTCSNPGITNENSPSGPNARWRHKARLSYTAPNGLGLSLQWRYFGKVKIDSLSSNSSLASSVVYDNGAHIKAQNYFDLAATGHFGDRLELRAGVNNLFDKEPPLVTSGDGNDGSACPVSCNGNTYPGTYDTLGRLLYVSATVSF